MKERPTERVGEGLGLHCWECNSAFDPRCGETHFDAATLDSVDCDQMDALKLNSNNASAIYCRKIIQRSKLWGVVVGKDYTVQRN
ncbi:hypothetical protein Pmani_025276 [Petrolisthes manimaculis]|uniref:Uncharacterized protein n=1 Tax=Petrolisthes manimaculis TaxID=1843537 RepID=A0AAE1U1C0_9EUCA|nr:hypothetical protein Pmani_025276 [Petrolisthes manimaculis]